MSHLLFLLDIKFYFHITSSTELAISWISGSKSYTNVEISHTAAGNAASTPTTLPTLPFANGGGFIDLPNDPILLYLEITVMDNNSNKTKMPPVYVDLNDRCKFSYSCFFLTCFFFLNILDF